MNHLKDYRPKGNSIAERLRNTSAELLVLWVPAIDELRGQYRDGTHDYDWRMCPFCKLVSYKGTNGLAACKKCPHFAFEPPAPTSRRTAHLVLCNQNKIDERSPYRRLYELKEWRKRIQKELKRRGV